MQWTTNKVLRSQLVGEKTQSDYIPLGLSIKSEGQHTGAYLHSRRPGVARPDKADNALALAHLLAPKAGLKMVG